MSINQSIKSGHSLKSRNSKTRQTKKQLDGLKQLSSKTKIHFDPKVHYEEYLEQFRAEFRKRWNHAITSMTAGLQGFTVLGVLGSGSFGQVKLVKRNATGEMFATKVLERRKFQTDAHFDAVLNEERVLYSIRFPNHTSLEFTRRDTKYLYLGMTLAEGGELFTYLRKLGNFSENQACFYAAQIFLALEYLHFMNLIYRDLKPENICFSLNGYIKIIDYGFTKFVPSHTFTLCGTPEYLSPEMIKMKPYSTSVDWWAFGVLLYEFVAGKSPFSAYEKNPMEMFEKICNADFPMLKTFTPSFRNLLSRLLQPNLSKRIGVCNNSTDDIRSHLWFKSIDWYSILNQEVPAPYVPSQGNLLLDHEEFNAISSHGIQEGFNSFPTFQSFKLLKAKTAAENSIKNFSSI